MRKNPKAAVVSLELQGLPCLTVQQEKPTHNPDDVVIRSGSSTGACTGSNSFFSSFFFGRIPQVYYSMEYSSLR